VCGHASQVTGPQTIGSVQATAARPSDIGAFAVSMGMRNSETAPPMAKIPANVLKQASGVKSWMSPPDTSRETTEKSRIMAVERPNAMPRTSVPKASNVQNDAASQPKQRQAEKEKPNAIATCAAWSGPNQDLLHDIMKRKAPSTKKPMTKLPRRPILSASTIDNMMPHKSPTLNNIKIRCGKPTSSGDMSF